MARRKEAILAAILAEHLLPVDSSPWNQLCAADGFLWDKVGGLMVFHKMLKTEGLAGMGLGG